MSVITYEKKQTVRAVTGVLPARTKKVHEKTFAVYRDAEPQLHYIFTLQINGVSKSWSVSRGPSMSTRDKRLAIMIQDQWISNVEQGNAQRQLWDKGIYEPENNNADILTLIQKGSITFKVSGRKLNGLFSLVKVKGTEDCWLLMKQEDQFAVAGSYNSEYYIG